MKNKILFIFPFFIFSCACSGNYTPKPRAYFYIDLPQPVYRPLENYSQFTFDISNHAHVKEIRDSLGTKWFNIEYPHYNAGIYCSYFPVNKETLVVKAKESEQMAYFHKIKADGIDEYEFARPEKKLYGLVYEIKGNVASPVQFVLTDSVRSFFRGALYFDNPSNIDSISPVLAYINRDIHIILESFQWKQ
ncbi:MAG: gliding motility lipoprotein GldD [Candidatus Symbiothrix sp.]|jgi:gliding motility-associated lipoprotein GldD|nr:gliding motility lipoprotein GldD [Candidatus Symbiothrix sp.]